MGELADYEFLVATGGFFYRGEFDDEPEDECDWIPEGGLAINLNDAWYWAMSDFEPVPKEKLAEVRAIYGRWGHYGINYWAAKQRGFPHIEFKDVRRIVAFIQREEELREREPSSSKRAYMDLPETPTPRGTAQNEEEKP